MSTGRNDIGGDGGGCGGIDSVHKLQEHHQRRQPFMMTSKVDQNADGDDDSLVIVSSSSSGNNSSAGIVTESERTAAAADAAAAVSATATATRRYPNVQQQQTKSDPDNNSHHGGLHLSRFLLEAAAAASFVDERTNTTTVATAAAKPSISNYTTPTVDVSAHNTNDIPTSDMPSHDASAFPRNANTDIQRPSPDRTGSNVMAMSAGSMAIVKAIHQASTEATSSDGKAGRNTTSSSDSVTTGQNQSTESFPYKVFDMLEEAARSNEEHIVSWVRNGTAFQIHDRDAFVRTYMSRFFDQTKYKSFQRQANLWKFEKYPVDPQYRHMKQRHWKNIKKDPTVVVREDAAAVGPAAASAAVESTYTPISGGPGPFVRGCYFHPLFQKSKGRECCSLLKRASQTEQRRDRAAQKAVVQTCVSVNGSNCSNDGKEKKTDGSGTTGDHRTKKNRIGSEITKKNPSREGNQNVEKKPTSKPSPRIVPKTKSDIPSTENSKSLTNINKRKQPNPAMSTAMNADPNSLGMAPSKRLKPETLAGEAVSSTEQTLRVPGFDPRTKVHLQSYYQQGSVVHDSIHHTVDSQRRLMDISMAYGNVNGNSSMYLDYQQRMLLDLQGMATNQMQDLGFFRASNERLNATRLKMQEISAQRHDRTNRAADKEKKPGILSTEDGENNSTETADSLRRSITALVAANDNLLNTLLTVTTERDAFEKQRSEMKIRFEEAMELLQESSRQMGIVKDECQSLSTSKAALSSELDMFKKRVEELEKELKVARRRDNGDEHDQVRLKSNRIADLERMLSEAQQRNMDLQTKINTLQGSKPQAGRPEIYRNEARDDTSPVASLRK